MVHNMYYNTYFLNCKQTSIAAIHLHFQRYIPVSPVVVCVTVDECLPEEGRERPKHLGGLLYIAEYCI